MRRSGAPSRKIEKVYGSSDNASSNNDILRLLNGNTHMGNALESKPTLTSKGVPSASLNTGPTMPMVEIRPRAPLHPRSNIQAASSSFSLPSLDSKAQPARYFSCVWCKKSGRKHKRWEGDGFIKVGSRSVTLVDENGKELGTGTGYKLAQLEEIEEGTLLPVGGKEVEISESIAPDVWTAKVKSASTKENAIAEPRKVPKLSNKRKRQDEEEEDIDTGESVQSAVLNSVLAKAKFKPFQIPRRAGDGDDKTSFKSRTVAPGVPMFDPHREGALVMPRPPMCHPLRNPSLVDVVMDPYIGNTLRPHQREGILFLYSNLLGYKTVSTEAGDFRITGAILADDMGLGKTLQTIALVWTLLKQSPVAGSTMLKRTLILAPTSLINNWAAEFKKWLGSERIIIHVADNSKKVAAFKSYNTAPVLIMSYEMLVRTEEVVNSVNWDLIVCDEAHRLKNSEIKTSSCLARMNCARKLLLTGTPVQNDLNEYYCLVSTVVPGLLGSKQDFNAQFISRIEKGGEPGCSPEHQEAAEAALAKLADISRNVLLRRTSDSISKYLPPKTVNVVFCRPTDFQASVYRRYVDILLNQAESAPGTHLSAISTLKTICSSPYLKDPSLAGFGSPSTWEEQSGKLAVLTCLLLTIMQDTDEKVVIVSLSTSTLDLLSELCSRYSLTTTRLDGSTPPANRQQIVNRFNKDTAVRVFLLSSKAGGTGLNLVGASRIVLYDIDWNPATDLQAMARIWRDGQKRHCQVYRLLTTGSIEEKIYQRQLKKSGLAGGLEAAGFSAGSSAASFTIEDLKDLFSFREDTECDTHDLLECECGGSGDIQLQEETVEVERRCQLGAKRQVTRRSDNMEQLKHWRHFASPIYGSIEDDCLGAAESFVSYVFRHFQDTGESTS